MSDSNDWSHGYPVGESYPASWHGFQSPAHLRAICALMGVIWEVGPGKPMCIAEVGCGTGYTALVLAAGNPGCQVIGMDYNPAHIAEARSMAEAAGIDNATFLEVDLSQLDGRALDDLPEFDLVTAHGLWSWVADPVRDGVLKLLQRRLKPGGVAMISYNALPASAAGLGLARLVRPAMSSSLDSDEAAAVASKLVARVVAADAPHMPNSLFRKMFMGQVEAVRPGYLRHEFQTEHWRPSFHSDMARAMASARCDYVGSATIDENFPQMSLSPAQVELWNEAPDLQARELLFDLFVARGFRRDVYVRGARHAPRNLMVDALWLAPISHWDGEVKLRTQAGEAQLPRSLIDTVRQALLAAPRTVGELRALPGVGNATPSELLAMLVGSGLAMPLWRPDGVGASMEPAMAAARKLNAVAASRLAPHGVGGGTLALATPLVAGGLACGPLELAVAALLPTLATSGRSEVSLDEVIKHLVPPGPPIADDIIAGVREQVQALLAHRLPVWRTLGIV